MEEMVTIIFPLTALIVSANGDESVSMSSKGDGSFTNVLEHGVAMSGINNFTFSVKGCAEAVIVFSDIVSVTNTRGRYFLVMLGANSDTHLTVMDSCFKCDRATRKDTKFMQCNTFVDVWTRWDGKGHFEVGKGKTVGEKLYLDVHGIKQDYPVHCIAVTSTNQMKVTWRFTKEPVATLLHQPLPQGHTIVEIEDRTPPGSYVTDMILKPNNLSAIFILAGASAQLFSLEKYTIKLAENLNFSAQRVHVLEIRSNIGFDTSLTVVVTHNSSHAVNDTLGLDVSDVIVIPEELPVGCVIAWNLTIASRNDIQIVTINGPMADFFTVLQNRELQIRKRLDRDVMTKDVLDGGMTLSVSDLQPTTLKKKIAVNIIDLNDNTPRFEKDVYIASVQENPSTDEELVTLKCTDEDAGANGRIVMSISQDSVKSDLFYLKDSRLYVKAGSLDYEGSDTHTELVIVQATDTPLTGAPLTGSVVVLVKVLPKDEFDPVWISPVADGTGRFPNFELQDKSSSGILVDIFKIADRDEGEKISYSLQSRRPSNSVGNIFSIDTESGELKTKTSIDVSKLGQVHEYNITVIAKSGQKVLTADVKVNVVAMIHVKQNLYNIHVTEKPKVTTVKDNSRTLPVKQNFHNLIKSSNLPVFNKHVYVIDKPSVRDWRRALMNFQVALPDSKLRPSVLVDKEAAKYFRVKNALNSWQLFLKHINTPYIPSDILLISHHPQNPSINTTAHVLLRDHVTVCNGTTSLPVVHHAGTARPVTQTEWMPTHVLTTHTIEEICSTLDYTSERILIVITIAEAAGLLSMLICRRKLSKVVKPKRRKRQRQIRKPVRLDPIGCEKDTVRRESIRRKSVQSKDLRMSANVTKPCVMTLAEVDNEELNIEDKSVKEMEGGGASRNDVDSQRHLPLSPKHPGLTTDPKLSSDGVMNPKPCVSGGDDLDQETENLIKELEQELDGANQEDSRNGSCDRNPDGCPSDIIRNYSLLEGELNGERFNTSEIKDPSDDTRRPKEDSGDRPGRKQSDCGSSDEIDLSFLDSISDGEKGS